MKKILYIDFPFSDEASAEKQRSSFFWNVLHRSFDSDLLLIKSKEYLTKQLPEHKGYEQVFSIAAGKPGLFAPSSFLHFSRENQDKLAQILLTKRYEMVFLRSMKFNVLINRIETVLPECRIIVAIDNLISEDLQQNWLQNPTWKNRAAQLEYFRIRALEKNFFHNNYFFIFARTLDLKSVQQQYNLQQEKANFLLLPSPLPPAPSVTSRRLSTQDDKSTKKEKYILFYGNLASEANLDAFQYLAKDIYPRVSKKLQEKDIKIFIAGSNPQKIHDHLCGGRIKLVGYVENLAPLIKESMLVVLPIRKQATAGSRILEAGLLQKAVLTTSAGAYDIGLGKDALAIEDNVDNFSNRLMELISKTEYLLTLGDALNYTIQNEFTTDILEDKLHSFLEKTLQTEVSTTSEKKLSIAIVTNFFGDESDKVGIHVQRFSQKLAETAEVTVFCPRRDHKPRKENLEGVQVVRLFDFFNYPIEYPNQKDNTLCLGLFSQLIKGEFDIIQCYPGLSHNYTLAYLAAKIKEVPVILNVFNFQDYEQIVKESGKADKNILKKIEVSRFCRMVLKYTDYLFTVTEKEYTCIRRFNDRVEHIPAPLLMSEYEADIPSVKEKYNIEELAFVFLCLGKVTYLKGQDIALKAFIKVLPVLQNVKFVFVGNTTGDKDFFEDLEALVSREALHEDVIFTGEVERCEVLAWLKESDIHVVPARFMNVGNVVIESWACATAVLQSDVVDPNLVIEGINGYLFRSEDVDDLAQQMQKAYKKRNILPELGEQGKALVKEKYTFDYLIKRYSKVYYQLTEGT